MKYFITIIKNQHYTDAGFKPYYKAFIKSPNGKILWETTTLYTSKSTCLQAIQNFSDATGIEVRDDIT